MSPVTDENDVVQAGGGVVLRYRTSGELEVLVVHRPKYQDWSLPKGKLDPGEDHEQAALREVEEETGVRCWVGPELSSHRYHDSKDRPKLVRWWRMHPRGGTIDDRRPDDEIDDVRWVSLPRARDILTYTRDVELLDEATS